MQSSQDNNISSTACCLGKSIAEKSDTQIQKHEIGVDGGAKSVLSLEKQFKKVDVNQPTFLENNLAKLLPEQISEATSESETDSEEEASNLLDDLSPRSPTDPSFSRPSSCIFVASLAAALTDSELNASVSKQFSEYGKIVSVKVLRDPANRPYAFVQYMSDEEALNALAQSQGITLNNRTIRCERAKVNRTVFISPKFVNNVLENKLNVERVVDLMSKFGELEQVVPSRDQMYKKNYYPSEIASSWFIQYAYRDDAIRAYLQMKLNYEYSVEWAQNVEVPPRFNLLLSKAKINELERYERERLGKEPIFIDNKSIFVGQLNLKVTKQLLCERFSAYGEIDNCNLIHKQEQGKCFAFIKYKSPASAAKALERENHSIFMDKILHVQIREVSNSRRGSQDNNKVFQGPQLNLAPPPLNTNRRASTGSFNRYMYPVTEPIQSPSGTYIYGPMHETRRNTINGGHGYYRMPPQGFHIQHRSNESTIHEKVEKPESGEIAKKSITNQNPTGQENICGDQNEKRSKVLSEDEESQEQDDDIDGYQDADDMNILDQESNSSFTTHSAGTGVLMSNSHGMNAGYQKSHGYKKRRNLDIHPHMNRIDANYFYAPPMYYSMEYCTPSVGPLGPGASRIMQGPAHLTGQCPPSQHSPFIYYFPIPPPTPTFNNPFNPREHLSGFKYHEGSDIVNGKADMDY